MSSTSSTFNDSKCNIKKCTSREKGNYAKSFRTREEIDKDIPLKKRSNEKVRDELSTFIAEFSYLTDGQDSKPEPPKNPVRTYNAYLVESSENNKSYANKKVSTRPNQNNNNRRRKSVEWLDQRKPYPDHRKNSQYYNETPVEASDVRRPYVSRDPRDLDYVIENPKYRSPKKRIKIKHEDVNSFRIPKVTLKRPKSNHDGVKLMKFRVESSERNKKLPYHKVRRKKSKPLVRYWPFRYEKKKKYRIPRSHTVRKESFIPLERKVEISSESPTVVTLYPKNARGKNSQEKTDELEFLANPDLPCKCFKCMRKYELLQKIAIDEPTTLHYKAKNELPSMSMGDDDIVSHQSTLVQQAVKCVCKIQSSHTVLHPKNSNQMENHLFIPQALRCATALKKTFCCNTTNNNKRSCKKFDNNFCNCPKNLNDYPKPYNPACLSKKIVEDCCRHGQLYEPYSNLRCPKLKPCPYPCGDDHFRSNWNLNEIRSCDELSGERSYKSVYFRFDCVGHQIDPAVTQYFHSILNNKIHSSYS